MEGRILVASLVLTGLCACTMARSCLGKRQGGLSTIVDQAAIYQGAQLPMRPMVEPMLWLMLAML